MRLDHLLSKDEEVGWLYYCLVVKENNFIFLVTMRLRETPVLIPNTMVKLQAAESTALVTAWEDRWLPDQWAYSSAG